MSTGASLAEPPLGKELLQYLLAGTLNRTLYPPSHPEVQTPLRNIVQALARAHREEPDVTLALMDGQVYLSGTPLREASVRYRDFLGKWVELGLQALRFRRGVSTQDLGVLIDALVRDPRDLEACGGVHAVLQDAGVDRISAEQLLALPDGRYELLQPGGPGDEGSGGAGELEEVDPLEPDLERQQAYGGTVGDTRALFDTVATTGRLDRDLVLAIPEQMVSELLSDPAAFLALLHLRSVGNWMFQHAVNVAMLSALLASKLELEEDQMRIVGLGALLHDIGELDQPIEIREKAGPLTDEEWALVHRHPVDGAKLTLQLGDVPPAVTTIVLEHHVHFSGGGYPPLNRTSGPHLYSRVVAVADAYDAIVHPRPYQGDKLPMLALERLLEVSGTALDPAIVKLLLHTIGYYPPGTPVTLSDGRAAVVESPTPGQPFLPRVLVHAEGGGHQLLDTSELDAGGRPRVCVLRARGRPDVPASEVERMLDPTAAADE